MARRSPASLMVIRLLLVSNGILVSIVGLLCFAYVERPSAYWLAGAAWVLAGLLFGCVRFTDPYRPHRARRRPRGDSARRSRTRSDRVRR